MPLSLKDTHDPPLTILPGIGFGPLVLGLSISEARELGEDFSQWEPWMGGNLNHSVVYMGVVAHDSGTGIDQIHVHARHDAVLFGMPIRSITRESLQAYGTSNGLDIDWEDADCVTLTGLWIWFDRFGNDGPDGPEIVIIRAGEER